MLHILLSIIFNINPVSRKNKDTHVETRVKDNVSGIREVISDKFFQHFFTTKPTGQGIGLGLSLVYDIVEAHGGAVKVETKPTRAGMDGVNGDFTSDKQVQYLPYFQ
jgi:signal transduction histidine kinase